MVVYFLGSQSGGTAGSAHRVRVRSGIREKSEHRCWAGGESSGGQGWCELSGVFCGLMAGNYGVCGGVWLVGEGIV